MADPQSDPVAEILRRSPATDDVRAQAWDIFRQAPDEKAFEQQIKSLALPDTVKADLWDLKHSQTTAAAPPDTTAPTGPDYSQAPTLGGMVGGAAGLALGGPMGAAVGAALGAGVGEHIRQSATGESDPLGPVVQGGIAGALELPGMIAQGVRATRIPGALMQTAIKPTQTAVEEAATHGIRTKRDLANLVLATPGARPTQTGIDTIVQRGRAVDAQILNEVKAAARGGAAVDVRDAAKPLAELAQRALYQANPESDVKAIDTATTQFLNHPLLNERPITVQEARQYVAAGQVPPATVKSTTVPVDVAQQMKQGTYKGLEGRYGELQKADIEAQKQVARGLATEVGKQVPSILPLNDQRAKLIVVEGALRDAINRTGNRDLIGFANVATGSPGRLLTALLDRSGATRAMFARALANPNTATAVSAAPILTRAAVYGVLSATDQGADVPGPAITLAGPISR